MRGQNINSRYFLISKRKFRFEIRKYLEFIIKWHFLIRGHLYLFICLFILPFETAFMSLCIILLEAAFSFSILPPLSLVEPLKGLTWS